LETPNYGYKVGNSIIKLSKNKIEIGINKTKN